MANNGDGKILWILDNGHGIDTPGKRSPMLTDGRQFLEYRFNREVVSMMVTFLGEKDLNAVQLVPEDRDIALSSRIKRANALNRLKPCVLV